MPGGVLVDPEPPAPHATQIPVNNTIAMILPCFMRGYFSQRIAKLLVT
jgi:hypothetical protein